MLGDARTFAAALLSWYDRARRPLPWRVPVAATGRPDPYHVLVSELMLQQTQVATVIPYFHRFLARFPTIADLAVAAEQDVLRLWQGLGYYSRARNLQRAAQQVTAAHSGVVPADHAALLDLPGVGRYTAGAVASIAFDLRAPILDGNVTRVLCRLDRIADDPRSRDVLARLWRRAEEILPAARTGDFNSAMMELGATVCTPRNPQCLLCPVAAYCEARQAGDQDRIPAPKKAKVTPLHERDVVCVRRRDGRWLIEQRPATGRWAGLWQFVTREKAARGSAAVLPFPTTKPRKLGHVEHALTHRRYTFAVRWCEATTDSVGVVDPGRPHAWVTLDETDAYPMSKPQLAVVGLLRAID